MSTAISLLNPGFELPGEYEHDLAKGWSCAQHAGADSFEFKRDSAIFRSGGFSLSMRRFGREPWGLCDQKVTLDASRPRRLEFGGYLRAEGVAPEAVELNLRFQRAGVLLKTARIRPDLSQPGEPWRAHSLSAEIPGGATHVVLGLELHGNGRVWLDDTWVQALP